MTDPVAKGVDSLSEQDTGVPVPCVPVSWEDVFSGLHIHANNMKVPMDAATHALHMHKIKKEKDVSNLL